MYRVVILTRQWFCALGDIQATSFTNIIHHLLADDTEFIFLAPSSSLLYIQVYMKLPVNLNLDVPIHPKLNTTITEA